MVEVKRSFLSHKEIEAMFNKFFVSDRQQSGKNIFVGIRSLIIQLIKLDLIDEFQLCIYPVVAGNGLPLFENINDRIIFKLSKTKTFGSGAIVLYYKPVKK